MVVINCFLSYFNHTQVFKFEVYIRLVKFIQGKATVGLGPELDNMYETEHPI